MKKAAVIIVILTLVITIFTGCGKNDGSAINVAGLKGPTSIGLVNLIRSGGEKYNFEVYGTPEEIAAKLLSGDLDIAAIPANLASVLYNKTDGKISQLAVNTLGVLYIVETGNEIKSTSDLVGKTIFATGKGTTPEYTLRYILTQNGIDPDIDVSIEWKSEATEVLAEITDGGIAMLPQPYVTAAQMQVDNLSIVLDLTEEWEKSGDGSLVTGVLVARSDFLEKHKKDITDFLKEYEASTELANENPKDTAALVEEYGIFKAAVAENAIPYCNITFITGDEMATKTEGYLSVLLSLNPNSIGGKLPEHDFYYETK